MVVEIRNERGVNWKDEGGDLMKEEKVAGSGVEKVSMWANRVRPRKQA